jgi:hypothetical protein
VRRFATARSPHDADCLPARVAAPPFDDDGSQKRTQIVACMFAATNVRRPPRRVIRGHHGRPVE